MVIDFKQRLLSEEIELHKKVGKLAEFLAFNKHIALSQCQQTLLKLQLESMQMYLHFLQERIKLIEREQSW